MPTQALKPGFANRGRQGEDLAAIRKVDRRIVEDPLHKLRQRKGMTFPAERVENVREALLVYREHHVLLRDRHLLLS